VNHPRPEGATAVAVLVGALLALGGGITAATLVLAAYWLVTR
jgi:hypothetical protein